MVVVAERLGEVLVSLGLLTREQFEAALREQAQSGRRLGEILVSGGLVRPDQLADALARGEGLGRARLADTPPVPGVPEALVRRHQVFPFARDGNVLYVAMADPSDVVALDDLRLATGCQVVSEVASPEEVARAVQRWYGAPGVEEALRVATAAAPEEDEEAGDPDAPVVRLVDGLIEQAVSEGASDLHLEPERGRTVVRLRVDGVLRDVMEVPRRLHPAVVTRVKVMAGLDIAERRLPQDGRIRLRSPRPVDLRVSVLPAVHGEAVVMRVLDTARVVPSLEALGYEPEDLARLRRAVSAPYGMVLLTGPTGSGKTTTLYAALKEVLSREKNVVTVEDPPEYEMPGVRQVAVNPRAGLTFASALRAILRQDPDVVMVGEIRDEETAKIAVQAAMTGHLVLSTLHTNDAASAPVRLVDMGVKPYLVASCLLCVAAQRLVRVVCPLCGERYELPPDAPERYALGLDSEPAYLRRGRGCSSCGGSGYRGRTAVAEVMVVDREVRELVRRGASADEIRDAASKGGMVPLHEAAAGKVLAGETTVAEVMRVVFSGLE
ncbi:MAG: GspE/PulE family protein [Bacillota bacterium]|nr:GspE/PulE family protein [Bacillota bacterium]